MENKEISLGKKGFWWCVRLIVLTPIWIFRISENKKNWKEFKNGLISHVCEVDHSSIVTDSHGKIDPEYYNCKHFGCGIVHPKPYKSKWLNYEED